MTLILEAEGVDLDALLADYGLRRYLQRPDPYARQIAMNILWTPKGTLHAVDQLADLLFADLPHATVRTGRSQQHVFVAATHPVTTPYSYWGLVSSEGLWYAVTVDKTVPTISSSPPPGLDLSPGPHTLTWFTVQDELGDTWYVSIHHETLRLETTPPAGHGTTEPFAVLDGEGNRWLLAATSGGVLVSVLDTGLVGFGTWAMTSHDGTSYVLWMDRGVPAITTTVPGGSTDQTPGGAALDWFTVEDAHGLPWYVTIEANTLAVWPTRPGGVGTAGLAEFLDASGQRWILSVDSTAQTLVATAVNPRNAPLPVIAPDAPFQAFQLVDVLGISWWISLDAGTLHTTPMLPDGATDVTPTGGPYYWWRVYDQAGTLWYVWPLSSGVLSFDTVTPGGLGTREPQTLGDRHGVLWHIGIGHGVLGVSDAPPVDYAGCATAVCMMDETGDKWFWRIHKQVLEWSPVLWPDTIDQSPWGELGWFQMANTEGDTRYLFATTDGSAMAAAAPPLTLPWGWQEPLTLLDASGIPWHFTVLPDDRVGVEATVQDDLPLPTAALPVREALEAFGHVQAAGSLLTLLLT